MVDLRLHDPGDLAVTLGAAPDLAFGPERMLTQFLDRGMIVVGDLVGQGKVGGVEDARLASEELEETRGFLDDEPRKRALTQAAVKQQDAGGGIERAKAEAGLRPDISDRQRTRLNSSH